MRCLWADGRGNSGEGNEVIAGQMGFKVWSKRKKSEASGRQVDNYNEQAWCCGNVVIREADCDNTLSFA